jgi:hypothetical protein
VTVIDTDDSHRCLGVEVKYGTSTFICIAVYFPVFENTDEYEENVLFCAAFIDAICSQYVHSKDTKFMIYGDFNYDMQKFITHSRLKVMRDLFNEISLTCCDHLDANNVGYTYKKESLGQYSFIDHVFVLKQNVTDVIEFAILDHGNNLSDHCAINIVWNCDMSVELHNKNENANESDMPLLWDLLDVDSYRNICGNYFRTILVPSACHCVYPCLHSEHKVEISMFADSIAEALRAAGKACCPCKTKGYQKHYWCDELNELKRLSMQAHLAWKEGGFQRDGLLNDNRLLCKRRYKNAVRLAKRNAGKKSIQN